MKRLPSRVGVGASSIMLIIVVVCLVLFAVLSLVTARNDAALSRRAYSAAETYYQADARAQETIAAIDAALKRGEDVSALTIASDNGDGTLSFCVETDDAHTLYVMLAVDEDGISILSYRYEATGEWNAGPAEEYWQGG